uniref:Sushi, von Willebrand factor type A, EGF and pentraxin domain-containing protein 1 n=1 Tax=Branchiostoma floridae TaxID=7739 RepID=C3XRS5_BRAFL|eukprot:XP_002613384.1 hypothetical protein BRAFLDRAFT_68379 [Branchiostoma floridae]
MRGREALLLTAAVLTLLLLIGHEVDGSGSRRRRRRRSTTSPPPVDCRWSSWSLFSSDCGNTCGGTRTYTRYRCRPAANGGADCVGDTQKTEPCPGTACQNGGQWNGASCTCPSGFYGSCCQTTLMCPPLDAPSNGQISSPVMTGGDVVYFSCDPGYTLLGSSSATCESSGSWSNNRPICQRGSCPALQVVPHGSMYGSMSTGSTMTFSCLPGYTLSGPSSITCTPQGVWSAQPPTCTVIHSQVQTQCTVLANPDPIAQGSVTGPTHLYGTTIHFACSPGYTMVGTPDRMCQTNGQWSGSQPTCHANQVPQCTALSAPHHGTISGSNNLGDTVTFSCDLGYELTGSVTRTCQSTLDWSGTQPTCTKIQCPPGQSPSHGHVTGNIQYGDTISYTCDAGYVLTGDATSTCLSTGVWSNQPPQCTEVRCPELSAPANGDMTGGNRYQNQVHFSCNTGYQLVGSTTLTCQADQTWSGPVPNCSPTQCPSMQVSNGFITGGTVFGTTASCGCDPGYLLIGPATTTCQSIGTWSASAPTCTIKDCQPLVAPNHGSVTGGNTYGDVATYACDPGYEMVGSPTQTCQDNQHWSGSPPYCIRIKCPTVSAPANGNMVGSIEFGDQLQFSCSPGHQLIGSSTLTCQADQMWDVTVPTCSPIQCPPLQSPQNGQVSGGSSYGDTNTYTCDIGYLLFGDSTTDCLSTGTWSSQPPQCTLKTCPPLTAPNHGSVVGGNNYGDVAHYACDPGYDLVGTPSRTCQDNQLWSGTAPSCIKMECAILDLPTHGTVNGTNFVGDTVTFACDPGYEITEIQCQFFSTLANGHMMGGNSYGDQLQFHCSTGYQLVGSSTLTCQADQTWSDAAPTCTRIQCPAVQAPLNGDVTGGNFFGSTATYTCDVGYLLTGHSTSTCLSTGTWSSQDPQCTLKTCQPLAFPNHGTVTGGNNYGNVATYTCDVGYDLIGNPTQTCQDNQQWTGSPPTCQRKECPPLSTPSNGFMSGTNFYGDQVTFTCHSGYEISGSAVLTCQMNQQWNGTQPTCERIHCPPLSPIANGQMSGGHLFGDQVMFVCNSGYDLSGSPSRKCQADGTWSGVQPACDQQDCGQLPAPSHGTVSGATHYGNQVTFTCDPGYEIFGSVTLTCQENQQWSGAPPTCTLITCPPLSPVSNGQMNGGTSFGDQVTFACNVGYSLSGSPSRTCLADGTWSGVQPVCNRVACQNLDPPTNGMINVISNLYGGGVTFDCNVGYQLVGSSILTCQSDQQWSGSPPSCQRIQCPPLSPISDGQMSASGSFFMDRVTFVCNSGFDLFGSNERLCQADGTWSGIQPVCNRTKCPDLAAPAHGYVTSGTFYGDTATYSCQIGYEIDGVAVRTCQADKTWRGMEPTCTRISCPALSPPTNGQMNGNSNFYGDQVIFACDLGFELNGSLSLICQSDGTWSGVQPVCNALKCQTLTAPAHGTVAGGSSFGDTATYSCDAGYEVVGTSTRLCQPSRTWSGNEPTCEKLSCASLDAPLNGGISGFNQYGDTVTFDCSIGFELVGDQTRTCQSDQQWNGTQPYCQRLKCPQLGMITNGGFSGGIFYGDYASFMCNAGYELQGNTSAVCMDNGQWSNPAPSCIAKECPPLTAPQDGAMTGTFFVGDRVTFSCKTGFNLVGSTVIVCKDTLTWSDTIPKCERKCCSALSIPFGDYAGTICYNDTITFNCDPGYEMFGATKATCDETGQWDTAVPQCQKLCCDSSLVIPNGQLTTPHGNCFNAVGLVDCSIGYMVNGNDILYCNASGQWEGKMPQCELMCCGDPGSIRDGTVSFTGECYGDVANYSCNSGFALVGNASYTCSPSGDWGPSPYCQPYNLCDRTTLAQPHGGTKICFTSPQGTEMVEFCQMHCNPGKEYSNHNEAMYECSAATGWLWQVRVYRPGGTSAFVSVNVGVCSSAYINPFAAVVASGLTITMSGPVDMAAIETEMRHYLIDHNLCTLPCQVGNIDLQIDPMARVGPWAKKNTRSNSRLLVSIQLFSYADESLITPTNTVQMEWVRLAGELREVLTTLEQPGGIILTVQGVDMVLHAENMQISPPSLGCQQGEVLEGVQCRQCGPGTYYDVYENDCRPCPYATYQDESAQTECKPCKDGTTTAMISARNSTQCQAFAECNCGIHPCKLTDAAGYVCDCLDGYKEENIAGELLCKECTPFQGNCYSVSETRGRYDQAKQECNERGGILAVINDQVTQDFFIQLLSVDNKDVWIGLTDEHFTGQWQWSDGTPINSNVYTFWAYGEPNGSGNCTHLWPLAGFQWDDMRCHGTTYHICQFTF